MMKPNQIEPAFDRAKEQYAAFGVDAEAALRTVAETPLSLHCWQGDDVRGFETADAALGGGIAVTGDYPGRARNVDELRADLDFA
jgi:L-rhamnose isomerase